MMKKIIILCCLFFLIPLGFTKDEKIICVIKKDNQVLKTIRFTNTSSHESKIFKFEHSMMLILNYDGNSFFSVAIHEIEAKKCQRHSEDPINLESLSECDNCYDSKRISTPSFIQATVETVLCGITIKCEIDD